MKLPQNKDALLLIAQAIIIITDRFAFKNCMSIFAELQRKAAMFAERLQEAANTVNNFLVNNKFC